MHTPQKTCELQTRILADSFMNNNNNNNNNNELPLDHLGDQTGRSNQPQECPSLELQRLYTREYHSLPCKTQRKYLYAFVVFAVPIKCKIMNNYK